MEMGWISLRAKITAFIVIQNPKSQQQIVNTDLLGCNKFDPYNIRNELLKKGVSINTDNKGNWYLESEINKIWQIIGMGITHRIGLTKIRYAKPYST